MPAKPIELQRVGKTGVVTTIERQGGVFAPIPGTAAARPVWTFGPPKAQTQAAIFTCPVSAIPDEVWQVVHLWNACRLTRTLPEAGGLLNQPMVVQRCFPILEVEFRKADRQGASGPEAAAAMAVVAMTKALGR